jgi:hypothetical protein
MNTKIPTEHKELALVIVASERDKLIRDSVKARDSRKRLENAAKDAVLKLGHTVDEVSEASGLNPAEIRALMNQPSAMDSDLRTLIGTR